eukprot:g549.t1
MPVLEASTNQARGLARYALRFMTRVQQAPQEPFVSERALRHAELFHADAALCGLSALALRCRAPTVLREEALSYARPEAEAAPEAGADAGPPCAPAGMARVFGHRAWVPAEKAVLANCAAVREWDSNGTVFGFHADSAVRQAGEFGHNDYYAAIVAAAAQRGLDGRAALHGFVLLDEVRGRLCESFSLKDRAIDHVLHGAIATAVSYGAILGASEEAIESAVGLVVAHHVPWRAIRGGDQLSDSKGASAAFAAETAVQAVHRAQRGFVGPGDVFRNPDAMFLRLSGDAAGEGAGTGAGGGATGATSPFTLHLADEGDDWAVSGMHFKLGVYEHQSAGALHALVSLLLHHAPLLLPDVDGAAAAAGAGAAAAQHSHIEKIVIQSYEPAYSIIGHPTKRTPTTRQSADHSMVFLVASLVAKALRSGAPGAGAGTGGRAGGRAGGGGGGGSEGVPGALEAAWDRWMLLPTDFSTPALRDPTVRALMAKVKFEHGGAEFDEGYPDGIPTRVVVVARAAPGKGAQVLDSGLVRYPAGHCRCGAEAFDSAAVLRAKMRKMARLATGGDGALAAAAEGGADAGGGEDDAAVERVLEKLERFGELEAGELPGCYDFADVTYTDQFDDSGIHRNDWL